MSMRYAVLVLGCAAAVRAGLNDSGEMIRLSPQPPSAPPHTICNHRREVVCGEFVTLTLRFEFAPSRKMTSHPSQQAARGWRGVGMIIRAWLFYERM